MSEAVRLVVWDLDETFWKGTLTEGGYTLDPQSIEIVKTLAARGIMSSICSKNDHDRVKQILSDAGVWDYFIFPSINWDPKGVRLKRLIEDVQLRAPTVLFIDDNPMNLNEALHFVPGLQVADETIIPGLLDNPLLQGKDDRALSRLAQYKLLEEKKKDEVVAGDNEEFLRLSDIRVSISNPAEAIDRAVELINRTNQLNFTKKRLSENQIEAREELLTLLEQDGVQSGLVHVVDKYGDYGDVGIYVLDTKRDEPELVHFCFSCRTLNMGVETWVYRHLGSPRLDTVGEVLGDVVADTRDISWVRLDDSPAASEEVAAPVGSRPYHRVIFRGGCEQKSFSHFFTNVADEVIGEFNELRFGLPIRLDHSNFLRYAAESVSTEAVDALTQVGFADRDVHSVLFEETEGSNLAVLSFWTDARFSLFRHRSTGAAAPVLLPEEDAENSSDPDVLRIRDLVARDYEQIGLISEEDFKLNLRVGLSRIPRNTQIAILLARPVFEVDGQAKPLPSVIRLNTWIEDVVVEFPHVRIYRIEDYVTSASDVMTATHFKKYVYHRLFKDFIADVAPALAAAEAERRRLLAAEKKAQKKAQQKAEKKAAQRAEKKAQKKAAEKAAERARARELTVAARSAFRVLDKTSRVNMLQFHEQYQAVVLRYRPFSVNMALALLDLGLRDLAGNYLMNSCADKGAEAPDIIVKRGRALIRCGLLVEAEDLVSHLPEAEAYDATRQSLRLALRRAWDREAAPPSVQPEAPPRQESVSGSVG
ncbi:HAD-IIIC family phosphatase [Segnochrobactraceae bacterium EtOH-i3]